MKIEVIEKRANQVRDIECPVCRKTATIVITEGRKEGSIYCWFCSSLLAWSIEDEVKPLVKPVEVTPLDVKSKEKGKKKEVKSEETE